VRGDGFDGPQSLGIAMFSTNGNDVETLAKNADQAMYLAKEDGKNTLNMALRTMGLHRPRWRPSRGRLPLDRIDPAQRGGHVRWRCGGSPLAYDADEKSAGGATSWYGASLARAIRT
jgi:hypothetical protein